MLPVDAVPSELAAYQQILNVRPAAKEETAKAERRNPRIRFINTDKNSLSEFKKNEELFTAFKREFKDEFKMFIHHVESRNFQRGKQYIVQLNKLLTKLMAEGAIDGAIRYTNEHLCLIYGPLKDNLCGLNFFLRDPKIRDDIKDLKILDILDGITLCIPGLVDRFENAVFSMELVKLGLIGDIARIKALVIAGCIKQYYHDVAQQRHQNLEGNEIHAISGLSNLVADDLGLPYYKHDFYIPRITDENADVIKKELLDYIAKHLHVSDVLSQYIEEEFQRIREIFLRYKIDIQLEQKLPLDKMSAELLNDLNTEVTAYFNAKTGNSDESTQLNSSYLFPIVGRGYYDTSRIREKLLRWISETVWGLVSDNIHQGRDFNLMTCANTCYWIEDNTGEERRLLLVDLVDLPLSSFNSKVLNGVISQALLNRNDSKSCFIFFSNKSFFFVIDKISEINKIKLLNKLDSLLDLEVFSDITKSLSISLNRKQLSKDDFLKLRGSIAFNRVLQNMVSNYSGFNIIEFLGNEFDLATLPVSILKKIFVIEDDYKAALKQSIQFIFNNPTLYIVNVTELLKEGVDLSKVKDKDRSRHSDNLLMLSVKENKFEIFTALLEKAHIDIDAKNKQNDTILSISIRHSRIDFALYILERLDCRKMLNVVNNLGNTVLTTLLSSTVFDKKKCELLKKILSYNIVDINHENRYKKTAVSLAISNANYLGLCELLKQKNLKFKIETALQLCVRAKFDNTMEQKNQVECLKLLLDIPEIKPFLCKNFSQTFLIDSIASNNMQVFKMLLACKYINVNARDTFGRTALHKLVELQNNEFLRELLTHPKLIFENTNNEGLSLSIMLQDQIYTEQEQIINKVKTHNTVKQLPE